MNEKSRLLSMSTVDKENNQAIDPASGAYVVDTSPLCQGAPFVLTDSSHPRIVIKNGSHFLVLDESGVIPACNTLGFGYYRFDTRHVSQWEYLLNDQPLSILSHSVNAGYAGRFLYTNVRSEEISQEKVCIRRDIVLSDVLWELVTVQNFLNEPIEVNLKVRFQSDFADIFEVRGMNRTDRGQRMLPRQDGNKLFMAYRGLDGVLLETEIEFFGVTPASCDRGEVGFNLCLGARQAEQFEFSITTVVGARKTVCNSDVKGYLASVNSANKDYSDWRRECASIATGNELFNVLLDRNFRDLYVLRQPTPRGFGIAAGVPWYSAPFGRDSAIVGLQTMPFIPEISRQAILVLAAYQGKREVTYTAESPGRIMHELRLGELARLKQVPHTPYYGTADATQLWLLLLCEYMRWTGDLELARQLWPNVKLALEWLDRVSDQGFIPYEAKHEQELTNQGWKDSPDSVMNLDGSLAEPPISLCEIQAYTYAAWIEIAALCDALGHEAEADHTRRSALYLKKLFQERYWMSDEQYLGLALDGQGRLVRTAASNAGQCLWTNILEPDKADAVAARMLSPDFSSGWGVRTLSSTSIAFNPISYHNGSVWPHDNSIIAQGLKKAGRIDGVHEIFRALYDAARAESDFRLPELFCGFRRSDSDCPIGYPVSCSPQAWASGALIHMLKICMSFVPDALNHSLSIVNPALPRWLGTVTVKGIRVGDALLDLAFDCTEEATFCRVLNKKGKVRVIVEG